MIHKVKIYIPSNLFFKVLISCNLDSLINSISHEIQKETPKLVIVKQLA